MLSERQRSDGPAVTAAEECPEGRDVDTQGPSPTHSPKAMAFWARMEVARHQPGACSRCGRPRDTTKVSRGSRGLCSLCRAYGARKREERRQNRARDLGAQSAFGLELARRVAVLEARIERFSRILRAQYKAGYQVGQKAERARWRNMPRGWDSWNEPLDITDRRLMSHSVEREA